MSRYSALQNEIDDLKRENARLAQIQQETPPQRTTTGIIEAIQSQIEDCEWAIIRARASIKIYEATIKALRKHNAEKRALSQKAKT